MQERNVDIRTADGTMETFVVSPDGDQARCAVVIYMDAPGIREELRDFARRVAEQGYTCLLPDMYYRRGRVRLDIGGPMSDELRREMFGHMRSLSNALVMRDSEALLDFVTADAACAAGPVGCIGYCMSGQYVVSAMGSFPERFKAGVSCYGVAIVTDQDDSPHKLAERVQGELLFAFAEHDEYVPDEVISTLRTTLERHGVAHQIEVYPGTEHGFCFPQRAGIYVEDAAEDVWRRTFELFGRQLKA